MELSGSLPIEVLAGMSQHLHGAALSEGNLEMILGKDISL